MAGREIRCIGPSYYLADRKTAVQRAVNLYIMRVEGLGEDSELVLESVPGLKFRQGFSGQAVLGMHNMEGRLLIVAGDQLIVQDFAPSLTEAPAGTEGGWPKPIGQRLLALEPPPAGRVVMAHGSDQCAIVDGVNLWIYSRSTNSVSHVVEAIVGPVVPGSGATQSETVVPSFTVSYLDGYFIFISRDSEQFFISAVDNAGSISGLDFSSADGQPDRLVTSLVHKRGLYLFGTRTCEVYVNTGAAAFPLEKIAGASIDVGAIGPYSAIVAADTVIWVGQSESGGPYVYRMQGYQPTRISSQAVEQALKRSTNIYAVSLWTYKDAGGEFVCINAPGLDTTWCWDAATEQWHERAERLNDGWKPLRVEYAAHVNGSTYVAAGASLYQYSREYSTLDGTELVRERTWPHLVGPNLEPTTYSSLAVRCTSGEESAQGTITLEISNDGGAVFGSALRRPLGAIGRRIQPIRWLGLGTCPAGGSRVFRLRVSDPVALTIQGAVING